MYYTVTRNNNIIHYFSYNFIILFHYCFSLAIIVYTLLPKEVDLMSSHSLYPKEELILMLPIMLVILYISIIVLMCI